LVRALKVQVRSLKRSIAGLEGTRASEVEKHTARLALLDENITAAKNTVSEGEKKIVALGGQLEGNG
jgi:hypothetical protein